MSATLSYSDISWLQLSDLHIFASTDWSIMQNEFEELAKVEKPKFIVMTGDFRHLGKNTSFDSALKFLEKLRITFHLDKKDMFLVPGNHDVNDYSARKEIIESIKSKMKKGIAKGNASPDDYCEYMYKDKVSYDKQKDLRNGFIEYCEFVRKFYGSDVSDERVTNPDGVLCINWRNKINIVLLNSALVSSEDRENLEVIDIYALSQIFSKTHTRKQRKLPAIILSHHPFEELVEAQRERLKKYWQTITQKPIFAVMSIYLGKMRFHLRDHRIVFQKSFQGNRRLKRETHTLMFLLSHIGATLKATRMFRYMNTTMQAGRGSASDSIYQVPSILV